MFIKKCDIVILTKNENKKHLRENPARVLFGDDNNALQTRHTL